MYRLSFYLMNTLIVGIFAAVASGQSAQSANNLTGAWRLNKNLSDDLAKVMEATHGGTHGSSGGGRHTPPSGRGGHGPGMHGGGRDSRGGTDAEQQMRMWLHEPPAKLTITQTDSSVTFTEGDRQSQTLATTNEKQRLPLGSGTVEVRTKWDDGRLVKETSLSDGTKVTETYSLVSEPRRLHVMVTLAGARLPRPVSFRRVYDAESTR
jgi:hypothetical protein